MKNNTNSSSIALNKPVVICFSSGKGGVGKTSISVNLAAALSEKGKKVLLVDGDLGLANVDIVLGINTRHTMREIIEDGCPPSEILVEITPGFFVLPASSGVPEMATLSYEEQAFLTDAVESVMTGFDFVFVDSAAGIGESVLWFNEWAHKNIVVLTPDPTSLTDAYALIKVINSQYGRQEFNILANNVSNKKEGKAVFDSIAAVLNKFLKIEPNYIGAVPRDNKVVQAIRSQKPFFLEFPDCQVGRAIENIAETIIKM